MRIIYSELMTTSKVFEYFSEHISQLFCEQKREQRVGPKTHYFAIVQTQKYYQVCENGVKNGERRLTNGLGHLQFC